MGRGKSVPHVQASQEIEGLGLDLPCFEINSGWFFKEQIFFCFMSFTFQTVWLQLSPILSFYSVALTFRDVTLKVNILGSKEAFLGSSMGTAETVVFSGTCTSLSFTLRKEWKLHLVECMPLESQLHKSMTCQRTALRRQVHLKVILRGRRNKILLMRYCGFPSQDS